MSDKSLRIAIVILGLILCWGTVMYSKQEQKLKEKELKIEVFGGGDISKAQTIDSLKNVIDSLRDELFIANVEIGRHELTREEILKPNKKLNKQYEEYYNHETE
jgi:hypothetical protein